MNLEEKQRRINQYAFNRYEIRIITGAWGGINGTSEQDYREAERIVNADIEQGRNARVSTHSAPKHRLKVKVFHR